MQLEEQTFDFWAKFVSLLFLNRAPGGTNNTGGQGGVSVNQIAFRFKYLPELHCRIPNGFVALARQMIGSHMPHRSEISRAFHN